MNTADEQTCRALAEMQGGELRSFGGALVFVPAVVEPIHLQAAVNYLLLQLNVRDGADQGGT